jgi:hypothetical protein
MFEREILLFLCHYKPRTTRINCDQKQFDVCLLHQHPALTPTPSYLLVVSRAGLRKEIVCMKFQQKTFNLLEQCFPKCFCLRNPFGFKNNYRSSHPFSRKYRVSGWEVSKIKVLHLITDLIQTPIHTSNIHSIALHDLAFITSKRLSLASWVKEVS